MLACKGYVKGMLSDFFVSGVIRFGGKKRRRELSHHSHKHKMCVYGSLAWFVSGPVYFEFL